MEQRVCIVTGGTKGIGYHLSEGFHKAGYKVFALDIQPLAPMSEEITVIETDLRDEESIKHAFAEIKKSVEYVHIIINNAGVSKFNTPILEMTAKEWDNVLDTNLKGLFLCCQEFIKVNKGAGYGRIINIASTRWHQNMAGWEAYGASKGGVVSFSNTLAVSLSNTGITVNVISPGWIEVENYENIKKVEHEFHPSGRVGKPKDILNGALFLANEENDFINGNNLIIDGGVTKKMIYPHEW